MSWRPLCSSRTTFGKNWNALWECITDLHWLKGSSYLVVFDSADCLLSQSDEALRLLLRMLKDAHEEWHQETADFGARGRQPIAFRTVLACRPDAVDTLTLRMGVTAIAIELL